MEGRCAELYPKEVSCSKIDIAAVEGVAGFLAVMGLHSCVDFLKD